VRVAVVDLTCNSPFFCRALAIALEKEGRLSVELVSPLFYRERDYLAATSPALGGRLGGARCRSQAHARSAQGA
jgi:hypothetical protein